MTGKDVWRVVIRRGSISGLLLPNSSSRWFLCRPSCPTCDLVPASFSEVLLFWNPVTESSHINMNLAEWYWIRVEELVRLDPLSLTNKCHMILPHFFFPPLGGRLLNILESSKDAGQVQEFLNLDPWILRRPMNFRPPPQILWNCKQILCVQKYLFFSRLRCHCVHQIFTGAWCQWS